MKKFSLVLSLFLISFVSFSFADSTLDQAISWMNQNGLTKFTNAQDFMANQNLRRDEATKFFVQYAKQIQKSISDETKTECNKFADLNKWRSDLADSMKDSCKIGLFQWTNWKFMPTQSLTNAQAITVVMRMIDGKQDETQWHFAQNYFERAKEFGIINWLNLNSTANFDKLATRWEVAILLFNASNMSGTRLNNQDFAYVDNQVKTINQKFKLDSKERQDYIESLYDKKNSNSISNKDYNITSKIIEKLEEKTNTVYLSWFKCTIINIESMVWGGWTSSNDNQIIGINLGCKNISKIKLMPDFVYNIVDWAYNTQNWFYTNNNALKNISWYKGWNFFVNTGIKSDSFNWQKIVNPWETSKWWMLAEVPKKITKIKYNIISADADGGSKIVKLAPIVLKSEAEQRDEQMKLLDTQIKDAQATLHKKCLSSLSEDDCYAVENNLIIEWMSEGAFDLVNYYLLTSWTPRDTYTLSISDSYLWKQMCKDTDNSTECVWIRNGKVTSKTIIYY